MNFNATVNEKHMIIYDLQSFVATFLLNHFVFLLKFARICSRLKTKIKKGRYTHLKITDVRLRLVTKDDSKLKGVASITIDDCFAVHDIKVIDGKDGLFISMPNRKRPDGEYNDIAHPTNTETREAIKNAVLSAYEKELNKAE